MQFLEIFRISQSLQPPKQPLDQNKEDHLLGGLYNLLFLMVFMAPEVGLEPTTLRLTAECSAIELLRIAYGTTPATGRLRLYLYSKCVRVGQRGGIPPCTPHGNAPATHNSLKGSEVEPTLHAVYDKFLLDSATSTTSSEPSRTGQKSSARQQRIFMPFSTSARSQQN
jgi:hypothetical protein